MNKIISAIIKKIIASLLIVNVCMIFLINSVSIATSENVGDDNNKEIEEAREKLAKFAEEFCRNKGNVCDYTWNDVLFELTRDSQGKENGGSFYFECTGFITCMIKWSLGLPIPDGYKYIDTRFRFK